MAEYLRLHKNQKGSKERNMIEKEKSKAEQPTNQLTDSLNDGLSLYNRTQCFVLRCQHGLREGKMVNNSTTFPDFQFNFRGNILIIFIRHHSQYFCNLALLSAANLIEQT